MTTLDSASGQSSSQSSAPYPDEGFLDDDGYPTEECLDYLRCFTGTPRDLVDLLSDVMFAYGRVTHLARSSLSDRYGGPFQEVAISTGGWSGNEEIISHLQRSFFWFRYWETSRRGGHYTFEVPHEAWDQPMMEWPPAIAYGEQIRRENAEYEANLTRTTLAATPDSTGPNADSSTEDQIA